MVIFSDLSEVLINGMCGTEEIVAARYGKEVAKVFSTRHAELMEEEFRELLRGNMKENEYWRIFLLEGHLPFGIDEAKEIFSENLKKVVPGTLDVYRRIVSCPKSLHRPGITIAEKPEIVIVSDHISERIGEIHRYHPDIFELTTREFWSCESGQLKADSQFFEQLLRVLDLKPDEAIFIDDSAYNTTAASLAGITSIFFRNATKLEAELEEYGFHFAPVGIEEEPEESESA